MTVMGLPRVINALAKWLTVAGSVNGKKNYFNI
jgi:hypothetical protein